MKDREIKMVGGSANLMKTTSTFGNTSALNEDNVNGNLKELLSPRLPGTKKKQEKTKANFLACGSKFSI